MRITYFGHSAFQIEGEGIKALLDPFLTDNSMCSIKPDSLTGITHIFVTHGHRDHIGDTVYIAKKLNSIVVSNVEMSRFFSEQGLRTHPMQIGGRISMDFGSVKMTTAIHSSSIATQNGFVYGGNPAGFVIEVGGKKVYHAGDTGLTMDMKLLEYGGINVAMLPIGGNYTMDIDDAVRAAEFIKPKLVIPMHYNTLKYIDADPCEFKNKVSNCKVEIMNCGDYLEI